MRLANLALGAYVLVMRAVQFPALDEIVINEVPDPVAASGEVVIRLQAAALNHRDHWIRLGQYPGLRWPLIPGSDGAGIVESIHDDVKEVAVGDEVIINASFDWGDDEGHQGPGFSILGLPRDGTLAERIAVPAGQVARKPAHLTWWSAAALPLAGLTAYRALFARARLQPSERMLISGAGGGVAQLALQFAVAHGAKAWVTSSDDDKIARSVELGAQGGFNYDETGWARAASEAGHGFDVILDSAGGEGFSDLVELCHPGARVVFFGATRGDPPGLPMRQIFWQQLDLLGTTMGSPADWAHLLDFVAEHAIEPVVSDIFTLDQASTAFDLMARGGQFGKIVFDLS